MKKKDQNPYSLRNVWLSIDKMITFGKMPWEKVAEFLNATQTPTFSNEDLWTEDRARKFYEKITIISK